ncbi:MAG: helix-turn-helix domain-containing protein [Candidatus Zixiibacteriota bacterium]
MRENKFRLDLFHRLNVVPMALPPLKERSKDIPAFIEYFLKCNGVDVKNNGAPEKMSILFRHYTAQDWTGNVRELKTQIDRLCLIANNDLERLLEFVNNSYLDNESRLKAALEKAGGSRRKAAALLGVTEGAVRYRIKKSNNKHDKGA